MASRLRIATFNLENLDDRPQSGRDFRDRLAILRPQLTRLRADVLCLQEVNARDTETPDRTIRGDEEDTGNGHLAIRTLVPAERSLSEGQRFSALHHGRPVMLDHILISRSLLGWYVGTEVHNEALGDELISPALVRSPPDSYHAPVVAAFEPPDFLCQPFAKDET